MAGAYIVGASLAALALTLSGCGGGGHSPNMDQPADFVSQSLAGKVKLEGTIHGVSPVGPKGLDPADFKMWLDVDTMTIRVLASELTTVNGTDIDATADIILDATSKNISVYNRTYINKKRLAEGCIIYNEPRIPEAAIIRSLIKAQLTQHKPSGSEDGMRRFDIGLGYDTVHAKGEVVLDDSNALHKLDVSVDGTEGGTEGHGHVTFTATTAQAGKPDANVFKIPSSWGVCETAPGDAFADNTLELLHSVFVQLPQSSPVAAVVGEDSESQKVTAVVV